MGMFGKLDVLKACLRSAGLSIYAFPGCDCGESDCKAPDVTVGLTGFQEVFGEGNSPIGVGFADSMDEALEQAWDMLAFSEQSQVGGHMKVAAIKNRIYTLGQLRQEQHNRMVAKALKESIEEALANGDEVDAPPELLEALGVKVPNPLEDGELDFNEIGAFLARAARKLDG